VSNARNVERTYANNQPIADAAAAKTLGRTLGERAGDVRHVCPHCGGNYAVNHGALIVVQTCPVCWGEGTISDADLAGAIARMNALED